VTNPAGGIQGFIGRDITGDPRAPKYRNPTRSPTFDKSEALYRPTHHELDEDALAIHAKPAVIALDGDPAGAQGTDRWLTAICLQRHRIALVSRLPANLDPAEWLKLQGDPGLMAFDRRACLHHGDSEVVPHLPGREVVKLSLATGRDPIWDTVKVLVPLVETLRPRAAAELLNQAEREMTCEGWNPNDTFTKTIRHSVLSAQRDRQAQTTLSTDLNLTETSVHRFPTSPSPGFT
jgi:DNA primase